MTVNDFLIDASIGHQVDLQMFANGVVRDAVGTLNVGDAALFDSLSASLSTLAPEDATVDRIEQILAALLLINSRAYTDAERALSSKMRDLTEYEAFFQEQLLTESQASSPSPEPVEGVSVAVIFGALMLIPFQGTLLSEAMRSMANARMQLIRETVRKGFASGKSGEEIVRELRGTKSNGFTDGSFHKMRRQMETVVRTALGHVAEYVRNQVYDLNNRLMRGLVWISVLDSQTSPPCRLRSGKRYTAVLHQPIGHSLPWGAGPGAFHWGCRSHSSPFVGGPFPPAPTYQQWLERQSDERQDQILGPTRGKLFRKGGVTINEFANNRGKWLTLDELRAQDAKAFRMAKLP